MFPPIEELRDAGGTSLVNDVAISILALGAVVLIALAVVYFGLVRRRPGP